MLRESHTLAKPHPTGFSLLTLLAVWLALALAPGLAFSFGRHQKVDSSGPASLQDIHPVDSSVSSGPPDINKSSKTEPAAAADIKPVDPVESASPKDTRPGDAEPETPKDTKDAGQLTESGQVSSSKSNKPEPEAGSPTGLQMDQGAMPTSSKNIKGRAVEPGPPLPPKNAEVIHRKDFSGRFSFVLPPGWGTYQIPYQTHDVLSLREDQSRLATITFSDEVGRNSLAKLKDSTVENSKEAMPKYELLASETLSLPGGQPCIKLVSLGQIDDIDTRQVQYIMGLKKKYFLTVTLTVPKRVGPKYDKLLQEVVTSISTNLVPDKATK